MTDAAISPPWASISFSEALVLLPHYHFTEHRTYLPLGAQLAAKTQRERPHFVYAMLNTIYK